MKQVWEASNDKFEGVVDADALIAGEGYESGSVARLLPSGIYHSDHGKQDDDAARINNDDWLNLGIDT